MREPIFRSPDIEVVRVPGAPTGPVFVTFDSFSESFQTSRKGFGEAFFLKHGLEAFHVIPRLNGWYQHPEMREALERVRAHVGAEREIITYGSSMGGYAAFRFSGLLNAARVLAFSPQFSADPARVPWERRWRLARIGLPSLWDDLPVSPAGHLFLFYDPQSPDRRHARLMSRQMTSHHVRLPHGGHPCIAMLQEAGLLAQTVLDSAAGRFDPAACERAASATRERSPRYLSNKAMALPRWAQARRLALAAKAVALAPSDPWYRVTHGRILADHGAWAAAETRYGEAMAMAPDHAPLLLEYRRFLMKAGRWAEAESVAARAVALAPEHLSHQREMSVIRAARAHAARPAVVRAALRLVRRDALRGV